MSSTHSTAFRPVRVGFAATLLGAVATAQLPFDLVETNVTGHPDHPGIEFQRHPVSTFVSEAGGVATVDVDNDGWTDVFFTDTEGRANHLYLNNGDGTFTEAASAMGIDEVARRRGSALFFDMENDGDLDLLSCGYPSQSIPNFDFFSLYRNDGAPGYSYTDVTQSAGGFALAFTQEPTIIGEPGGAALGDVDGNGYADAFVAYWNRSFGFFFDQPRLLMNYENPVADDGTNPAYSPRVFEDGTVAAGLDEFIDGWLWASTLMDFDLDGDLDLRINLDHGFDVLRMNDGTGVFGPDIANITGINGAPPEKREEMGVAFGDIDFDGLTDIYATNAYLTDRFWSNRSNEEGVPEPVAFSDVAALTETNVSDFGWGAAFADMDNDGDLDLLTVAGMGVGFDNHYHENRWPELEPGSTIPNFVERTAELPDFYRSAGVPDIARNLATADFDLDGDLDVIVGRYGDSGFVAAGPRTGAGYLENTLDSMNHWTQVDLRETNGSLNVIGARVHLRAGPGIQLRTVLGAGSSHLTQLPYRQHFGYAEGQTLRWITVRWFDGGHTVLASQAGTPPQDMLISLERGPEDSTGDMNGNGTVDSADLLLLKRGIRQPEVMDSLYGWWPWQIVGDINGDAILDALDIALLEGLLP